MRFSCKMYETSRLTARARSLFYPRSRGLGKMMRTILKSTQKWERSTLKNGVDFIVYATKMVWTNRKEGSRKPRISQYHFQDFPGKSAFLRAFPLNNLRPQGFSLKKSWGRGWVILKSEVQRSWRPVTKCGFVGLVEVSWILTSKIFALKWGKSWWRSNNFQYQVIGSWPGRIFSLTPDTS